MITLIQSFGNHSNRLFQNLHFEAFCMHEQISYNNITFGDMEPLYTAPVKGRNVPLLKLRKKLGILTNYLSFDNENDSNRDLLKKCKKKNCFVKGWGFRVPELTEKYQDIFIEKYSLKHELYRDNAIFKILSEQNEETIKVGVHLRRGDYKHWQGGKFYYDDSVYVNYIDKLEELLNTMYKKEIIFILFSNEPITLKIKHNYIISKNSWYIDQHMMSICNYLIGPPSTFTMWASYMGKNKYYHIKSSDTQISIENFKNCKG